MSDSFFSDKQFVLIVAAWFVFSFLVLWFIGGGCLNPVNGTACISKGSLSGLSGIPVIGWFLPFDAWPSLMYFLAPIAGFIFAFVAIRWWNVYFDSKEASGILFLVIIFVVLLVGYYINLSFYMGEAARLNSQGGVKYSLYFCISETTSDSCSTTVQKLNNEYLTQAQTAKATSVSQFIPIYFWGELRKSMFFVFILGAIAGWLPLFAKQIYEQYSKGEN